MILRFEWTVAVRFLKEGRMQTALIIAVYSFMFTGISSLLVVMLVCCVFVMSLV